MTYRLLPILLEVVRGLLASSDIRLPRVRQFEAGNQAGSVGTAGGEAAPACGESDNLHVQGILLISHATTPGDY